jgi:hypothetical protein
MTLERSSDQWSLNIAEFYLLSLGYSKETKFINSAKCKDRKVE